MEEWARSDPTPSARRTYDGSNVAEVQGDPDPRRLLPDVQRANPLRPVYLVRRERHQVDPHLLHVHGDLSDALGGITVEQDAFLLRDFSDLLHRIDRPDLVVGQHDRDEDGLVGDGPSDIVPAYLAGLVDRQVSDFDAPFRFESLRSV